MRACQEKHAKASLKNLAKTIWKRGDAIALKGCPQCGNPKKLLHKLFYITGDSHRKGHMMKKNTQHIRILMYFETHRFITQADAYRDLGITKLATRISELKQMGYLFEQEMIEVENRYGEITRVMQYSFIGRIDEYNTFTPAIDVLKALAA